VKRLLAESGPSAISVNQIVAEAGIAKGSFFHHFKDRTSFLVFLHDSFHQRVAAEIEQAVKDMPHGAPRIWKGSLAYLDFCFREKGVRALLFEARTEADVWRRIKKRNLAFVSMLEPDLRAAGAHDPEISARFWLSLLVEAALMESDAGAVLPPARSKLSEVLGSICQAKA
jgi:AcrR family transcriptional regulator